MATQTKSREDLETKAAWVKVTPQLAARWLTNQQRGRHVRPSIVAKYANDMGCGYWVMNPQPIIFGEDGQLLDGQHRLKAVIESGCTVRFLVTRGAPPETNLVVDTGAPRKFGDYLTIHRGVANGRGVAAVVKFVVEWDKFHDVGGSIGGGGGSFRWVPSHQLLLEAHDTSPELFALAVAKATGIPLMPSVASGLWVVFNRIDEGDADDFFARLRTGDGLGDKDPILLLRNQLFENRRMRLTRWPRRHVGALVIKAWNAYREGRKMNVLTWRPGGRSPEGFPQPV